MTTERSKTPRTLEVHNAQPMKGAMGVADAYNAKLRHAMTLECELATEQQRHAATTAAHAELSMECRRMGEQLASMTANRDAVLQGNRHLSAELGARMSGESDRDLLTLTGCALAGLLANPNIVVHDANCGWRLCNVNEEQLSDFAAHMASAAKKAAELRKEGAA